MENYEKKTIKKFKLCQNPIQQVKLIFLNNIFCFAQKYDKNINFTKFNILGIKK